MFGEVADATKSFTSYSTTHDKVRAILGFPFQKGGAGLRGRRRRTSRPAAQDFAAGSLPASPRHPRVSRMNRARRRGLVVAPQ
jgi:hypothetical protein